MDKVLLWRAIYTPRVTLQSDSFCAGPWHPSEADIQQCTVALSKLGPVGVQSNKQATSGGGTGPAA